MRMVLAAKSVVRSTTWCTWCSLAKSFSQTGGTLALRETGVWVDVCVCVCVCPAYMPVYACCSTRRCILSVWPLASFALLFLYRSYLEMPAPEPEPEPEPAPKKPNFNLV